MKNIASTAKNYRYILALLGYILIIFFVFERVLSPPPDQLIFGDDIHRSYNFFRQFFVNSITSGEIPWWNPYLFSGEPFIANPSVNFWYPPNWLFLILSLNLAYSWIIVLHIFLAMVGMFWLARHWFDELPSWIVGLTFGLSGYFMARVYAGHSDIITSAPYLPIVFGLFWRSIVRGTPRSIILAGGALAIQIFAGYIPMALFTMEAVGIMSVVLCLQRRSLKPLQRVFTGVLIGLGLAAIQLIPSQEFFRHSIRTFELPYSWAVAGATRVSHLIQLLDPNYFGSHLSYRGPFPGYPEFAAYIGKIPLVLAVTVVIGFIIRLPRLLKSHKIETELIVLTLLLIAFFALWVSMAYYAPLDLNHILWRFVSIYTYMRVPSRHLLLFVFSTSLLAGYALHILRHRWLRLVLSLLIAIDLITFAKPFIVTESMPYVRHDSKLIAFFLQQRNPYRLLPNFSVAQEPRDSLDFDSAMSYRIFSASGYDPAILRNYYEFISAANGIERGLIDIQQNDVQVPPLDVYSPYTDFLNIRYILVPPWNDVMSVDPNKRFILKSEDSTRQYRLYENTSVFPRFFIVPAIKQFDTRDSLYESIQKKKENLTTMVLVDNKVNVNNFKPDCPLDAQTQVKLLSYRLNQITLKTKTSCNAFLTSSEVMYPGWTATIDGSYTQIFEGNLAFRALYVPTGEHTVLLWYSPRIFVIGGAITLVTLVGCLFILRRRA